MANIIVTGGSRGLGLAIARRLAAGGQNVIAIARNENDQLMAAIREAAANGHGGAIHFQPFDLSATGGLRDLVKDVRKRFGPISGLVNNAALGTSGLLATMHDARIERLIHLNVTAPILLTKYVVRAMMADGGGRIVNIASIVGFTGFKGLSAYAATKSSIIGFTRSLAREVGPLGITVNAIAPGFIDTEMTQELDAKQRGQIARRSALGRMAEPDDVAGAVEFLLGPNARNITGIVLTVDAGGTA
jgi:3-oxoacyl-[acyl-carrier protein] reductase